MLYDTNTEICRTVDVTNKFTFLFLAILIAGCETLGLRSEDDEIEYDFVTEQGQVAVGDSVKAIFVNRSTETVFIFPECPRLGIEKRTDSSWREIELSPPVACIPGIPLSVESGTRFTPVLEPWMLEGAEVEPGMYRLTLVVGPKRTREEAEPQRITSNRFEIVQ